MSTDPYLSRLEIVQSQFGWGIKDSTTGNYLTDGHDTLQGAKDQLETFDWKASIDSFDSAN